MFNTTYIHHWLKPLLNKEMVVADLTAGNGNDTYFLALKTKSVFAFDIQEEAILKTKEKCKELNNIYFFQENHAYLNKYLKENIDLFIANFGYLPNSDSKLTTKKETSIKAIDEAFKLLKDKGIAVLTFYRGHDEGQKEYFAFLNYLNNKHYQTIDIYQRKEKILEPITYFILKNEV